MKNSLGTHTGKVCTLLLGAMILCAGDALGESAQVIDLKVNEALETFYTQVKTGKDLAEKAKGVLTFPSVIKAGFGVGGEYGEGALRIDNKTVDYYSTAAASVGLQLGAQAKTIIYFFMQKSALDGFRESKGFKVGVDGSVAVAKFGAGGTLDTETLNKPIIAVVVSNKGLMYNLTLEGSKITKLNKK